jgi:hypothetical protein
MKKSNTKKIFLVLFIIAGIIGVIYLVSALSKPKQIDYNDFREIIYVESVLPEGQQNDPVAQGVKRNSLLCDLIGVDGVENPRITSISYEGGKAIFEVKYQINSNNKSITKLSPCLTSLK